MSKVALVVDDSRVARMTLSKLLMPHFFEVIEIGSGEEAIAHLHVSISKPDIIFMDVMMRGMDGLTATRQIKSDSALSSIPIVICTGNDNETDRENALATGAMAVLSKPPEYDALDAILSKFDDVPPLEIQQEMVSSPEVDSEALAAKIMLQIEQDVRDLVGELVTNQVAAQVNSLVPNISEQAVAQSKQATEELARQVATQAAQKAVQNSIAEVDFSAQILQTLSSEGSVWLRNQEQQIYARLTEKLEQAITNSIHQHLETELTSMVAPIVSDQVSSHLAQQKIDNEKLAQKVSQLKGTVISLGIVVLALAVVMASSFNLV